MVSVRSNYRMKYHSILEYKLLESPTEVEERALPLHYNIINQYIKRGYKKIGASSFVYYGGRNLEICTYMCKDNQ